MKIFFLLLLTFLPLIAASCGCDEVYEELHRERNEDTKYHACRNCKEIEKSVDACPEFGYECKDEWSMTTNVLFPTERCGCLVARCDQSAQMAFNKTIVNKIRCNNSHWTSGDAVVDAVVCANSCNSGVCKASNSHADSDLKPLVVKDADADNKCATGTCPTDYAFVAITSEGASVGPLDGSTLTCQGDGNWRSSSGAINEYVMCQKSTCDYNCNPDPFPAEAWHLDPSLLIPATRRGCASTCPASMGLFYPDIGAAFPMLVRRGLGTCESDGQYKVTPEFSAAQIGCYPCDLEDGPLSIERGGDGNATVKNCILMCDDDHILTYYVTNPADTRIVDRLYRVLIVDQWFNDQTNEFPTTLHCECKLR